jgi:hypothetical protein
LEGGSGIVTIERFGESLRYALYVITHPFDGFWDLTHEKRGTVAAAHFITLAMIIVNICLETLSNFQFHEVRLERFNVVYVILAIIVPLALWTTAKWGLTTLFDGKGKFAEIYMATAYAFTPYVITTTLAIIISHFLTFEEGIIYTFLTVLGIVWSVGLVIASVMMVHDYSLSKALLACIFTIVGIGIMLFVFTIFFSLISDGIAYFVSLYKELAFRMT